MITDTTTVTTTTTATGCLSGTVFIEIHVAAGRLRDTRDPRTGSLAVEHACAVDDVRRVAIGATPEDGDSAITNALRRMVYEALHALDEDVLRDLRTAMLAGSWRGWMHELSDQAVCDRDFARAIAASAIASAGESALHDAMAIRAGAGFSWRLDADEIVRTQHCSRHDVFCCLACPDEPTAAIE